jgi:hypothetical protein
MTELEEAGAKQRIKPGIDRPVVRELDGTTPWRGGACEDWGDPEQWPVGYHDDGCCPAD